MTEHQEVLHEVLQLIGRFGSRQVLLLLRQWNAEAPTVLSGKPSVQVLAFLRDACERLYAIDGEQLEQANHQTYYEARNACYLLLSRELGFSYRTIGEQFGRNRRQVAYGIHKLTTLEQTMPEHPAMKRLQLLRSQLIDFLNQETTPLSL